MQTSENNRKLMPKEIQGMVEERIGVNLGLTRLKRNLNCTTQNVDNIVEKEK
jgi:hypothetical protein